MTVFAAMQTDLVILQPKLNKQIRSYY